MRAVSQRRFQVNTKDIEYILTSIIHNILAMSVKLIIFAVIVATPNLFVSEIALGKDIVSTVAKVDEHVRIGVLAKRGKEHCLIQWNPTAEYLTTQIPGHTFQIIPLYFDDIHKAVDHQEVDFVLVNSSLYVDLEMRSGVMRIATLKNIFTDGSTHTSFAGVIFHRSDRDDIKNAKDLKNKIFMAVDKRSFGGWQMAWRELLELGIDPHRDFSELRFGGTHDAVVYAVRDAKVDAGTVRCGTLENMALEGKIKMDDFHILGLHEHKGTYYLHSTRSYPEWPLAKTSGTTDDLAEKVAAVMVRMSVNNPVNKDTMCTRWTIPQNYQPVHECLMALRIPPYKNYGKISLGDILRKYKLWLLGIFCLITLVFIFVVCTYRLRARLDLATLAGKEHDKLIAIFDAMKDGIYIVNENHDIQYMNHALEIEFGSFGGEKCYKYLHNLDSPSSFFNNDKMLAGETSHCELTFKKNNKTYDILGTAIKDADGNLCKLKILRDITTRKKAEIMLQQAHDGLEKKVTDRTAELEEANLHLQELDKLKSMFIASMSHELRTPLNSIIGFSGLLLQGLSGDLNDEQKDSMERIHRSGNHLLELISDVIDISKIEAGRIDVFCEHFSLKDVVEESIESTRPQADAKGLTLQLNANIWPEMYSDRRRLLQCLLNFLSNAVKYSEKGKITVSVTVIDDSVQIQVSDTGIGIPPDKIDKLFNAFERLESHLKVKAGGTGLGLYLTRKIANDLLHGSVSVESVAHEGSVFGLKIPIKISGEEQ